MTITYITDLLKSYGLSPRHALGQNFLLDEIVLIDMIEASGLSAGDCVVEIGPGIGTLTSQLLQRAKFVLAIEKDDRFKQLLYDLKKQHPNFRYEFADSLHFDIPAALPKDCSYKIIANIPYYITGKIIQQCLNLNPPPTSLTILVQKEVAENVVARPGKMNLLALSVQLKAEPKIIVKVPARSFYPAPKVDSAVLHIDLTKKPKLPAFDEKVLFRLAKACFTGKRKQLHNTLAANLRLEKPEVEKLLAAANAQPASRPQELSIHQWIAMSNEYQNLKI